MRGVKKKASLVLHVQAKGRIRVYKMMRYKGESDENKLEELDIYHH